MVPESLTLANWDLGGEPSAWAYLHAGELFATTEIPPWRRRAELDRAELASVATFPVRAGMTLDEYVAAGPVSGMVVVLGGRAGVGAGTGTGVRVHERQYLRAVMAG